MRYIAKLTKKEIEENHKHFTERISLYKELGQDFIKSREFILEQAGPLHGRILEIGAGSGYATLSLAKKGYKLISIDPDKEVLRKTALNLAYEKLLSNVELYIMDGKALKFGNESFQIVVVINLFHHIEGVDGVLSEIDRVLCPGGKVIMADFNKKGMKIIDSVHHREGRVHENSGVSKDYVYSYFNELGYKIRELKDNYHWILMAEKCK